MTFQFSDELTKETIACFKDEHDIDISQEKANEYLMSLSNLYLAYSMPNKTDTKNLKKFDKVFK